MSKKNSKKVTKKMDRMDFPGLQSWESFWRGIRKGLRSKKFLAFVGASLTAAAMEDWSTVFLLTMVYIGVQGAVDMADKFKR